MTIIPWDEYLTDDGAGFLETAKMMEGRWAFKVLGAVDLIATSHAAGMTVPEDAILEIIVGAASRWGILN